MGIQRLVLEEFEEDDYQLIAIHCSLPSYRLAFLLNKNLQLRLFRKKDDINFKYAHIDASYPYYQYMDAYNYTNYNLVKNTYRTKSKNTVEQEHLFYSDTTITKYLIPECNKVDYFLKIITETATISSKALVNNMLSIPQIITAYSMDQAQLKSKNNLIFE